MLLSEYYSNIDIDYGTLANMNSELSIGNSSMEQLVESSTEKKRAMLLEAESSTREHSFSRAQIEGSRKANPKDIREWNGELVTFYEDGEFSVGAVKPGKEAAMDYKMTHYKHCKCAQCEENGRKPIRGGMSPNVDDMLPVILRENANLAVKITNSSDGTIRNYTPWTLDQICRPLEDMFSQRGGRFALEIFGTILFRSALNMDHHLVDGDWRHRIPADSLRYMESCLPNGMMRFTEGQFRPEFPVSSLLQFFDILGVNEDIKVKGKGRVEDFMEPLTWKRHDTGAVPNRIALNGRTNTLLTYCEMISIMLSRSSVGSGLIGYQRGMGMFPMPTKRALLAFPLLSPDFESCLDMDVNDDLGWLHGP